MFGDELISSVFNIPFLEPMLPVNRVQSSSSSGSASNLARERCSLQAPRDIFEQFSQAADRVFEAATKSIFQASEMFPRHFYPSYLRDTLPPPSSSTTRIGVTLGGDLVERRIDGHGSRPFRHASNDRVQIDRTRLQWYDSNTRRAYLPPQAPPRAEPSGRLTKEELAKLPLSVYRIPNATFNASHDESSGNSSFFSPGELSPVVPVGRSTNNIQGSPSTPYLDPVSRTSCIVEIQPLQSSPSRGHPECEVCLTEYRNNDHLRHLPCGHAFHKKCIDVWFNQSSTCPKCRAGVRTGLKRLERSRNRSCGPARNAPVRAIRERSANSVPVHASSARGHVRATQTAQTQRTNSGPLQNNAGGEQETSPGSASSRSSSPVPHELPRMANPNSPVYSDHRTQRVIEPTNNRPRRSGNVGSRVADRSGSETAGITPRRNSTTQRTAHIQTEAEKSRIARQKAAEAAIRRAEQAQQERAERAAN